MPESTGTSVPAASAHPDFVYHLTEAQHHKLYQVRHLCETLCALGDAREEFVELRRESVLVTVHLILELFDQAGLDLVWRPRHVN